MTSHRILITAEYLNAHFFSVFLFVYALQVLSCYFMQIFVISFERLNSPVYSAPPCISCDGCTCMQKSTSSSAHLIVYVFISRDGSKK